MPPSQDSVGSATTTAEVIMSGSGSPPSEKEWELIKKFRSQVEDVLETEEQRSAPFLLRWIRGRDENLEKAETMLRNSLKWRKENDLDKALTKPLDPFIKENYPYHTMGHTHQGHAVRQCWTGSWDLRKAMDAGKDGEFQDFVNHFFESIMVSIRESGNVKLEGQGQGFTTWPQTQFVYIVDWEGYSYSQLVHWKAVQALLKFGSQYEAHYPEIVYRVYFVNCPGIMPLFMTLLKPLLAPRTYAKIRVYGSNKDEWEPVLRELMDPEMLWTRLGGYKVIPK